MFILLSMIEETNQKYSNIKVKKEVVKEVEDPNMWAFDEDLVQNNKNIKPNRSEIFSSKTERWVGFSIFSHIAFFSFTILYTVFDQSNREIIEWNISSSNILISLSYLVRRVSYFHFQNLFLFLFPFISRVKNNGHFLKTERQSDIANNEKHVKYDKLEEIHTSKKLQKIAHFNSKNILNAGQSFISPFVGSKMETLQRSAFCVCVHSFTYRT
jgi:hypothetical protein